MLTTAGWTHETLGRIVHVNQNRRFHTRRYNSLLTLHIQTSIQFEIPRRAKPHQTTFFSPFAAEARSSIWVVTTFCSVCDASHATPNEASRYLKALLIAVGWRAVREELIPLVCRHSRGLVLAGKQILQALLTITRIHERGDPCIMSEHHPHFVELRTINFSLNVFVLVGQAIGSRRAFIPPP
jgi:hypothetical protein